MEKLEHISGLKIQSEGIDMRTANIDEEANGN